MGIIGMCFGELNPFYEDEVEVAAAAHPFPTYLDSSEL